MQLDLFKYESSAIRTAVGDNGSIWFVAKDIAEILDYASPDKAYQSCKFINNANSAELNKINNLPPATKWIPESDVYRLIMRSNKPEADKFQDWVVEEVLPSIRKTGSYSVTSTLPATYIEALEALVESEKAKAVALEQQAIANAQVAKLNTVIDNEFGWSSILRAAKYAGVHESHFQWRILKAMTLAMQLTVKRVPSPRFGYQNLYPIKAFERSYPDIDFDGLTPELLDDKLQLILK